jgi:alpha-N-arabinofuranosidase
MKTFKRALLWIGSILLAIVFILSVLPDRKLEVSADGNLAKNPGFEVWNDGQASDWGLEQKVSHKGSAAAVGEGAHGGRYSLKLAPNRNNTGTTLGDHPFGVGQGFPAGPLRGKKIYVSGWIGAEGGATALVGVYAVTKKGGVVPVELREQEGGTGLHFREDVLVVPDDRSLAFVVLACSVYGTEGAAYFDDIYMSTTVPSTFGNSTPAPPTGAASLGGTDKILSASVTVDPERVVRQIPATLFGTNIEWIWDANGMWDTQRNQLNPEVVSLASRLGPTLIRFPGGFFSDFYHWRDAIGPQAGRKETVPMPGSGKSKHVFGTDEALSFADAVGGQLLITVNAGTGTAEEAADWVRYVNRDGKQRVQYWEVGNELYLKDDSPWSKVSTLPPDRYARRVVEFAKAMRAADPSIRIGAIGEESFSTQSYPGYRDWTDQVLKIAGNDIDFLSVHNAYSPGLGADKGWDLRTVYSAMLAAPALIKRSLDRTAEKIQRLVPGRGSAIKIAITEWGPYYQITTDGRFTDHVKTLGSALYVASAMKVFMESGQTEIANSFKLVDPLFMGWIGKRGEHHLPTGPFFATEMYTRHFGRTLVESKADSPSYRSPAVGLVDPNDTPYLDVMASTGDAGRKLFVLAINKHFDQPINASIDIGRFNASQGTAWVFTGPAIDSNTGTVPFAPPGMHWARQATDNKDSRFDTGGVNDLKIERRTLAATGNKIVYSFPPRSIVSLELDKR